MNLFDRILLVCFERRIRMSRTGTAVRFGLSVRHILKDLKYSLYFKDHWRTVCARCGLSGYDPA